MVTGRKKAFLVLLSVLLMFMFAASAEADQTKRDIEAGNPFMTEAISEALDGIRDGHGGPFGCVIVRDGEIIGQGHNMVLINNDSTAHGEIVAIRSAEQALDSYDLSGCILYTTGEPCPCACMRFSGQILKLSTMAVRLRTMLQSASGIRILIS